MKPGEQIGQYVLESRLGRGSSGEVWLGKNVAGVGHALKFLPFADAEDCAKAEAEVQKWKAASGHPNVVPVIDAFSDDDMLVIVSEYVEGGTLAAWLKKYGGQSGFRREYVRKTKDILEGLAHLHAGNIVHRDLSAVNILLQRGKPRITDFGLSRIAKSTVRTASFAGSPAYSSPEAFRGKIKASCDLWAAGVLFYQMLSGRLPFPQDNIIAVMNAVLNDEPEPLTDEDAPPELRQFVKMALHKTLANRFPDAMTMLTGLEQAWETARAATTNAGTLEDALLPSNHDASPVIEPARVTPVLPETFTNRVGMEFVLIKPGRFIIGSGAAERKEALRVAKQWNEKAGLDWFNDEGPQQEIVIRSPFYMGKFQVTQAQWRAVLGDAVKPYFRGDNLPMDSVSWYDAQAFVKELNNSDNNYLYRLPSEAEWEYACRAGTTTAFAFGDSLSSKQANFNGNYPYGGAAKGEVKVKTAPIGSYAPNKWGLYDMHGNVWEWCEDIYRDSYKGLAKDWSPNVGVGDSRLVMRGGSYISTGSFCRSANRGSYVPNERDHSTGFRLVAVART